VLLDWEAEGVVASVTIVRSAIVELKRNNVIDLEDEEGLLEGKHSSSSSSSSSSSPSFSSSFSFSSFFS